MKSMTNPYISIAEGFEKLAAGYRALADSAVTSKDQTATAPQRTAATTTLPAKKEEKPTSVASKTTKEQLAAIITALVATKKQTEVKAALAHYNARNLSSVAESDYDALKAELDVLMPQADADGEAK